MRFVIQRVAHAEVAVNEETIGKIEKGYLVLIGIAETDTREIADKLIRKMIGLRIFEDENGKTNLSLSDVGGSLLLVSQFSMQTVRKETDRVLSKPDHRKKRRNFTNTSLQNVKKACRP